MTTVLPGLPERLLTMKEVADYLGVSVHWVRDSVQAKRVPCTRIGKLIRFSHPHVEEMIRAGEQPVTGPFVPPRRSRAAAPADVGRSRSGSRSRL